MLCEHISIIKNRYTGQFVPCSCGHCPTCLQQKASRLATRIVNSFSADYSYYFVTLTYSNQTVPFVLLSDSSCSDIYSYRSVDLVDYVNRKSPKLLTSLGSFHPRKLTSLDDNLPYFRKVWYLKNFPCPHAVAVHSPDDGQLFLKRLRKYLYKYNNHDNKFQYFASFEYGETTYRPHIHFLFKTKISADTFKSAIMQTWTYCDYDRLQRWFEIAISPAKYLASYLGDSHYLPLFYRSTIFRQRFTHSIKVGFSNAAFSLTSVFENARKGIVTYHSEYYTKNGFHFNADLSLPLYVVNRWFPKIHGFSRMSYDELVHLGTSISNISKLPFKFFEFAAHPERGTTFYSVKQLDFSPRVVSILYKCGFNFDTVVSAYRAFMHMYHYSRLLDVSFDYYLLVYYRFYNCLYSFYLKKQHENDTYFVNSFAYYLNLNYNLPDLCFIDDQGLVRRDDVRAYMDSNPLQYIYDRNIQKSFLSKNLKKVKNSTKNYYNYG